MILLGYMQIYVIVGVDETGYSFDSSAVLPKIPITNSSIMLAQSCHFLGNVGWYSLRSPFL